MKEENNKASKILATIFIVVIFIVFICNWTTLKDNFLENGKRKISPANVEKDYNNQFYGKLDYITLNGGFRKLMNQKILNGVVKGENDNLFLETDVEYKFNAKEEKVKVKKALKIMDSASSNGAKTLYVQAPFKFIEGRDKLPYDLTMDQNKKYDYWFNTFKSNGFNSLDLRSAIKDNLEFYKTDHHWTVESAYYAACNIIEILNSKANFNLDENNVIRNINNYDTLLYKNSFLGSMGIRTGEFFSGKDDFSILVPKYETSITYKHYKNNKLDLTKKGSFLPAFIDKKILDDKSYNNKYNANLFSGHNENIIINHKSDNNLKLLLISDSFSRPMVQYLGLGFKETRYLDPQKGRYTDSYIQYIKEYKPDVVIMMYSGDFVKE